MRNLWPCFGGILKTGSFSTLVHLAWLVRIHRWTGRAVETSCEVRCVGEGSQCPAIGKQNSSAKTSPMWLVNLCHVDPGSVRRNRSIDIAIKKCWTTRTKFRVVIVCSIIRPFRAGSKKVKIFHTWTCLEGAGCWGKVVCWHCRWLMNTRAVDEKRQKWSKSLKMMMANSGCTSKPKGLPQAAENLWIPQRTLDDLRRSYLCDTVTQHNSDNDLKRGHRINACPHCWEFLFVEVGPPAPLILSFWGSGPIPWDWSWLHNRPVVHALCG